MTYEALLNTKPTSGGIPVSSDPDWLSYLADAKRTGDAFSEGWADHYPSASGDVPVVASKVLTTITTTSSFTITAPSSVAAGDLVVVFVINFSTASATSISGFTKRSTAISSDGTDTLTVTAFDKVSAGSEPGTYTCTMSGSTSVQGVAMRITGADTSAPYEDDNTWESDAYALERRLPTVTTSSANNLLIGLHHAWYGTNSNAPSGWTAEYTDQNDLYLYTKTAAGAGATGNTDFDDASTYNLTASIVLAYKPTAASGGFAELDTTVPIADDNNNPYSLLVSCTAGGTPVPAPTFSAVGTAVSGAGTVSPAWPTHATDDIALLFVETCGGQAASLSSAAGFVEVTNAATGTTTNGTRLTVFWCRATSAAMSAPTVADSGNHQYARIITFSGCIASGDPWDTYATDTKASASTSASAPTATTTVDNTLVVVGIARDTDSAAAAFSGWTNANLASITEQSDAGTTAGNGGGFGVATGVLASAGSVGTTTATVSSSINASVTIALKPPAAVGGSDPFGAGKIVDLDLTSATFGVWVYSTDWADVAEMFLLLCNDDTPTDYYEIELSALLTTPSDSTWYYLTWSLSDMTPNGSPDISAITYMVAGAAADDDDTEVRFGRFTLYPFADENLKFYVEVLVPDSTAIPVELPDTKIIYTDDFTTAPTNDTYIKHGSITQSSSAVNIGPYSYLKTLTYFDIHEAEVVLKTNTFPSGSLDLSFIGMFANGAGLLQIYRTSGALGVAYWTPDTPYSITNYAVSTDPYWRFKHSGTTVTFSRSADGSSWTDIASFTTNNLPSMRFFMTYEDWASSWSIDSLTVSQESVSYGSIWTGGEWFDISNDVLGIEGRAGGRSNGRAETGTATISLANDDLKYSIWTERSNAAGGNPQYFAPGTLVRYGVYGTSHWFPRFTGLVRNWKETTDGLEQLNTVSVDLYQPTGLLARIESDPVTAVGDDEVMADRISRLLTASSWQYGYTDVSTQSTTYRYQETTIEGNRLAEIYNTVDTKGAHFRSSRRGTAFTYWLDTDWLSYDPTTDIDDIGSTLPDKETIYLSNRFEEPESDEPNTVFIPYEADSITLNHDDSNIVNTVTLNIVGGGSPVVVTDDESIEQYGTRTITRIDLIGKTNANLSEVASRFLRTQVFGPDSCIINGGNHPHCLAYLMMLDADRMVLVKGRDAVVFRTLVGEYTESILPRNGEVEWSTQVSFKPYSDSSWWRL